MAGQARVCDDRSMTDAPLILPADVITVAIERPLRMAVDAPALAPDDLVGEPAPETRVSAVPAYKSRLSFDWRRGEPLARASGPGTSAS
jgi:hypothetical protein